MMTYELLFTDLLLILLFADTTHASLRLHFVHYIFNNLSLYLYGLIFLWILGYFPSRAILYFLLLGASVTTERSLVQ